MADEFRQKQETAAAADREFRLGLEELVRGHIEGRMALASCSSDDGAGDDAAAAGGDGGELLARRRRRSDLEGDDLAESSAAARRQSRILSRWVARQAEEMVISTIERRNRESELIALAGLHTVSMLHDSFLRESRRPQQQPPPPPAASDRPVSAAASAAFQRWRELEDESAAARDRRAPAGGNHRNRLQRGRSDVASESDDSEYRQWSPAPLGSTGPRRDAEAVEEDRGSSREQSPDLGDVERERVRQIARGWMTESAMAEIAPPRTENPRAEWLGETERERVRLVREWVQMASQQRDSHAGHRAEREQDRDRSTSGHEEPPEHMRRDLLRLRGRQARLELIMRIVSERERELQGLSEHRAVSDFAYRNRIQSLLRGRFLRNGRPMEDERSSSVAARELGQLSQRHPVSGLREGFRFRLEDSVRGEASSHSEALGTSNISHSRNDQSRSPIINDSRNDLSHSLQVDGIRHDRTLSSIAVEVSNDNVDQLQSSNENGDIRQTAETHPAVGMESRRPNDNADWQESLTRGDNWQEEDAEHEERDWQQSLSDRFTEWRGGTGEESEGNWQENIHPDWTGEALTVDREESHLLEANEEWHEDDSREAVANWEDGPSDPPRNQRSNPIRRINRFTPPDDDNVYSMELRELLSRRSVSNLLRSGFRESLDQLIQSYVQRRGRARFNWNLQGTMPTPATPEQNQVQQGDDPNQDQQDSVSRPPHVLPPPIPPPQPLWHNWTRQSLHRSETEWDALHDLKAEMARLQQGMNHMQRTLEACMDMQLELQRSIRQEVSAALNRSIGEQGHGEGSSTDGSKWGHVRKGTCCVCCDNHIDALLYRCGHMCTCLNCANELIRGGGKCPLCRAPIIEVIRAYSIL